MRPELRENKEIEHRRRLCFCWKCSRSRARHADFPGFAGTIDQARVIADVFVGSTLGTVHIRALMLNADHAALKEKLSARLDIATGMMERFLAGEGEGAKGASALRLQFGRSALLRRFHKADVLRPKPKGRGHKPPEGRRKPRRRRIGPKCRGMP